LKIKKICGYVCGNYCGNITAFPAIRVIVELADGMFGAIRPYVRAVHEETGEQVELFLSPTDPEFGQLLKWEYARNGARFTTIVAATEYAQQRANEATEQLLHRMFMDTQFDANLAAYV